MPTGFEPGHETELHRAALTAHCRRMLGSAIDAEDAVQETMLRAWRASGRFEGRAQLSTWLHRIATNVCLDALARRARQPAPVEEWLEPMDISAEPDPAERVLAREELRLALMAAVDRLAPRQRAVLLLRDVLSWHASEVAELLDTSTTAVNSALQRAHATLERADFEPLQIRGQQRELLGRYLAAFDGDDIDGLVALAGAEPVAAR
jgi:RNA polymerase sigma-70 factor (ECF subfamily)